MANLPTSKVILSNKDYSKLPINIFQKYAYANFEDSNLLKVI